MDFGTYLLHTQRITIHEYQVLFAWQSNLPALVKGGNHNTVVDTHLNVTTDLGNIRLRPLGPILESNPRLMQRIGKTVDQLVEEWQAWHRDHMEPIGTYPLTCKFGPEVYERQLEKQLVGAFLLSTPVAQGTTLILDGDIVAIPEGTSALYVGLAIAAKTKTSRIITSNGCLLREFRDNPAIATSFDKFYVIGGEPDFDNDRKRSEHAGFVGKDTQELFTREIVKEPPATVVIIPFLGMLPDDGPFDVDANMGGLKQTLIDTGLKADVRVRQVVFIGDYTKHLESKRRDYRVPVYPPGQWLNLFQANRDRISVVTAPPPELRDAMKNGQHRDVRRRDLSADPALRNHRMVREYDRAAKRFEELSRGTGLMSRFYEAYEV